MIYNTLQYIRYQFGPLLFLLVTRICNRILAERKQNVPPKKRVKKKKKRKERKKEKREGPNILKNNDLTYLQIKKTESVMN